MTAGELREMTRRRLSDRQAEVVGQLIDAAEVEVELTGYDGLSVRGVAKRAAVAPATAYTYFSSKDHLLAELLWRRVAEVQEPRVDLAQPLADRLGIVVHDLGAVTTGSPAVVAACTQALLSSNPDVKDLRSRIGAEISRRLAAAVGDGPGQEVVAVLVATYFGTLLTAGMGHMAYEDVEAFVVEAARLMSVGQR